MDGSQGTPEITAAQVYTTPSPIKQSRITITANRSSEENPIQAGFASVSGSGGAAQQQSIETASGDGALVPRLTESEKNNLITLIFGGAVHT